MIVASLSPCPRRNFAQATFGHPGPEKGPTHCLTHCEDGMQRLADDEAGSDEQVRGSERAESRRGGRGGGRKCGSVSKLALATCLLFCFRGETNIVDAIENRNVTCNRCQQLQLVDT